MKGTTHPDAEGRVVAFANYPDDAIPEGDRLLYVVCLVDMQQNLLSRLRLVPFAEFHRRAYRERSPHPRRVTLQFSCRASGDEHWDSFEVRRLQLAALLEPLVGAAGPATVKELTSLRDRA